MVVIPVEKQLSPHLLHVRTIGHIVDQGDEPSYGTLSVCVDSSAASQASICSTAIELKPSSIVIKVLRLGKPVDDLIW